ncbi:hypothetical protein [Eubacterium sp.]|uniref:plasmid mobilization protein n=1 Tax=Eubacterium sp. TaxID=142586 RepID=UPI0026DF3883|nr:hypothetical protein [Eubacterium sp.]MDO5433198.1 hypothetical protein [Eubacterium sp.]
MRNRRETIQIRVREDEKNQIITNSKKCGLSVSEYLRMLARGYEPKPLPSFQYRELMTLLYDIQNALGDYDAPEAIAVLEETLLEMHAVLAPERRKNNGHHQNLARQGQLEPCH